MPRFIVLLGSLCLASTLFGQHLISVGVKGGVPLTDAFSDHTTTSVDVITRSFSNSTNYVIGLTAELRLPLGFSVEADALYRPLNVTVNNRVLPSFITQTSTDIHSAEFPILGKYHFLHVPLISPYVEAGPIFRAVGSNSSNLSSKGFAMGGGVDIKLLFLRISPEIRYSRWGEDAAVNSALAPISNRNQGEFLIGVSF